MDQQADEETIQRPTEETWPKKRTLLIDARTGVYFIRAERLVKQFREDVHTLNQRPGRHHGIAYGRRGESTIYAWYTKNQVTLYFDHTTKE